MEELQFATELPTYSDKKVSKILSHLKIARVQDGLNQHFIKLVSIEECFKKSQTFSFEKGTELFHKHLEELKKEGLNLHGNLNQWQTTPLGFAARQRSPGLVNALLQAKADVNYGTMNGDKSTNSPLHLLCMEIIHYSRRRNLPLSSIQNYQTECTEILIRSKANLESLDEASHLLDTPLFLATRNGYDNVVKLLVNAKANLYLDIINKNVNPNPLAHRIPTPLHVIAGSEIEIEKSLLVTKTLVNVGIDFFTVNLFKETAADEARSSKKPAVFCYLNNLMVDFMSETKAVLNQIGFPQALAPIVFDYLLNPQYSSHEEIKYRCYTRYRYQVESTSDAKQIPIEKRLTKL